MSVDLLDQCLWTLSTFSREILVSDKQKQKKYGSFLAGVFLACRICAPCPRVVRDRKHRDERCNSHPYETQKTAAHLQVS